MTKNKGIVSLVTIVAIIIGGYYFFSIYNKSNTKEVTEKKEISDRDLIINNTVNKYGAIKIQEEYLTYTLQAQERLLADKMVLFTGFIDDVFRREEKTFIRFSSFGYLDANDYELELECDNKIVDKILSQENTHSFNEYVVITKLHEISKVAFELQGSAFSEDDVDLNIETSDMFTAKGTCVDAIFIQDGP
jgi:hypothetical protein